MLLSTISTKSSAITQSPSDRFQPLYDYLTRQTGVKVDHSKSDCFYNTISCEISEGLEVSRWATRSIVDQMADLKGKTFSWMVHTKQLKRLAIGLFLNELTEKLQNFGNDLEPPKKLNLYATVILLDRSRSRLYSHRMDRFSIIEIDIQSNRYPIRSLRFRVILLKDCF